MADPKPLQYLAILVAFGVGGLLLWWVGLPFPTRLQYLLRVAVEEQASSRPPLELWTQVEWLWLHRLAWLSGFGALGSLALVLGWCEGLARRRRDAQGGYLYRWWVIGVISLGLVGLGSLTAMMLPWSLVTVPVVPGLVVCCGVAGYGLGAGRPAIR